jgi:hypothetical protein
MGGTGQPDRAPRVRLPPDDPGHRRLKLGLKAGFFVSIRIRLRYDPHIDVHLGQ